MKNQNSLQFSSERREKVTRRFRCEQHKLFSPATRYRNGPLHISHPDNSVMTAESSANIPTRKSWHSTGDCSSLCIYKQSSSRHLPGHLIRSSYIQAAASYVILKSHLLRYARPIRLPRSLQQSPPRNMADNPPAISLTALSGCIFTLN